MQASSAISFRLPPASFSAAAWPGSPLTFCFPSFPLFRFCRSLGFRFHDRLSLPLLFLTPAVFAFFRPLQFWVLTTQPLFFFSAFFTVPPPSGFPAAPSLLSLLRFSPSVLAGFPSFSSGSAYSASLFVSFRPSLFRSHSCSTGACLLSASFPLLPSDICLSNLLLSFVRFRSFRSGYSVFSLFRSASSQTRLAPAYLVLLRFFRRSGFPRFPSSGFPYAFFPFLLTWFSASFPFVLPNFAPAAVPLVLALSSASFPLLLL